MKQSQAFHKGIRRVWSRLSAGSGTSRQEKGVRYVLKKTIKSIKFPACYSIPETCESYKP